MEHTDKAMTSTTITTIESLKGYLYRAMQLEHATIPPYLTALYSIHPQTNADAYHTLRIVSVEEMLHLTIAANLLNAIGGKPDLTGADFVPEYPAYLPDGEKDFQVGLECFSRDALEIFLKIERPGLAPDEEQRRIASRRKGMASLARCPDDDDLEFYSIGDFYEEIVRGFEYLFEKHGPALFSGDPARQVTSEQYYSGGGRLNPVVCIDSAREAIELIIGQGEGDGGGIYDNDKELAHFYRFEQLKLGRFYQPGDPPHGPTGAPLEVNWEAVFPTRSNPRLEHYRDTPELYETAKAFNQAYAEFLELLTRAFNGQPQLLLEAVPQMFVIRNNAAVLIRNPLPGSNAKTDSASDARPDGPAHAAPTFEVARLSASRASDS